VSLSKISNSDLLSQVRHLAKEERRLTRQILERISEVEIRRLYSQLGFSSTFAWLVEDLGYSHGAADRRLKASRYLRDIPDSAIKIESGALNVTTLSLAQNAIQNEQRRTGQKISLAQKQQIEEKITAKSSSETEKVINEIFPELNQTQEEISFLSEDRAKMSTTFTEEQWKDLERVREVVSHSHAKSSWSEIIHMLSKEFLDRKDPLRKRSCAARKDSQLSPQSIPQLPNAAQPAHQIRSAADQKFGDQANFANDQQISKKAQSTNDQFQESIRNTEPVPAAIARFVRQRDQDRWTFKDLRTGRLCASRIKVQVDLIQPRALGGSNHPDNLRCLCQGHNLFRAETTFQKRPRPLSPQRTAEFQQTVEFQ
jgi:hypothetical protein